MTAGMTAVYLVRPATSYRLLAFGAGGRAIGLVTAAFALLPLFLAIPLGRLADRRHDRPLLVGGCSLELAACLLLAWARTPLGLGVASAVLGVGHLALALGVQAVVARESDPDRHDQHFGLLTAAVSLGQLVGPLLAGVLLGDRGGGALRHATGGAMVVAAGVAGVAIGFAMLAELGRPERDALFDEEPRRESVRAILSTHGIPAGIFASLAVLASADVFTAYLPLLGNERGLQPRTVGVLLAVRAAASIGGRVGIGTLVRLAVRLTGNRVGQVAAPAAAGVLAGSAGAASVFWMVGAMLVASALAIRRPLR